MSVPPHLHGLIDDASAASPPDGGLDGVVRAHREHRQAWYGDLVGPLLVADSRLPRLAEIVTTDPAPLEVVVAVSGGAGALEPAVRWATRQDRLELRGLHVAMRESDAGDLAPNARRIVAAADALVSAGTLDEDVSVYVEPPPLSGPEPTASWLSALDELATMDHRLTLRAAGPSGGRLAAGIDAALDRELRFRCTGLRRALRHPGGEEPGFLNVLLATRALLDGASPAEACSVLEESDVEALTAGTDATGLASAHRWFTSFDSDSVADPLGDLVDLGWLGEH